jgi:hypothetical protein
MSEQAKLCALGTVLAFVLTMQPALAMGSTYKSRHARLVRYGRFGAANAAAPQAPDPPPLINGAESAPAGR